MTFAIQELFDHHVKEIHNGINVNLKCPQCNKYFKTKNGLKTHLVMHTEETPYQCNMCEKAFKLKKRLNEHINSFHIVYECNECNIVFLRRTEYKVHLLAKHPNSESNRNAHLHECDHCHQAFLNKSSLENHMKSHSEERPFECDGCNKRFKHKKHLKSHQKFNCGKQRIYPKPENCIRHQCSQCEKSFVSSSDHKMHERMHDGTNPHYCTDCDKYFLKRSKLLLHLENHQRKFFKDEGIEPPPDGNVDKMNYKCDKCDKVFLDKRNFKMHEMIHLGTNPFHCGECDHYFLKQKHLDNHMVSRHSSETPFPCNQCDKAFKFQLALDKHKKFHEKQASGMGRFLCPSCSSSFDQFQELKEHLNTSTSCFSVSCDVCGQKFLKEKQLARHKVLHTNEKPFVCEVCNKAFAFKWDLKKHSRVHSKELQFQCDRCDKSFVERRDLKEHLEWHITGRFSHQCHLCSRSFKRRTKLKTHIQTVHEKLKQFACSVCHKQFSRKHDLKKHEEIHSKEGQGASLSCIVCNQTGFTQDALVLHQYSHMRVESNTKSLNLSQLFKINKDLDVPNGVDNEEVIETVENQVTSSLKPESALFNKLENDIDFESSKVEIGGDDSQGNIIIPDEDLSGVGNKSSVDSTNVIINPELQNELVESLGSRIELHFNNEDQTLTITEIRPESDQTGGISALSLQSLLTATNQSMSEQMQNVTFSTQQEAEAAYLTEVAARYTALLAQQHQQTNAKEDGQLQIATEQQHVDQSLLTEQQQEVIGVEMPSEAPQQQIQNGLPNQQQQALGVGIMTEEQQLALQQICSHQPEARMKQKEDYDSSMLVLQQDETGDKEYNPANAVDTKGDVYFTQVNIRDTQPTIIYSPQDVIPQEAEIADQNVPGEMEVDDQNVSTKSELDSAEGRLFIKQPRGNNENLSVDEQMQFENPEHQQNDINVSQQTNSIFEVDNTQTTVSNVQEALLSLQHHISATTQHIMVQPADQNSENQSIFVEREINALNSNGAASDSLHEIVPAHIIITDAEGNVTAVTQHGNRIVENQEAGDMVENSSSGNISENQPVNNITENVFHPISGNSQNLEGANITINITEARENINETGANSQEYLQNVETLLFHAGNYANN